MKYSIDFYTAIAPWTFESHFQGEYRKPRTTFYVQTKYEALRAMSIEQQERDEIFKEEELIYI